MAGQLQLASDASLLRLPLAERRRTYLLAQSETAHRQRGDLLITHRGSAHCRSSSYVNSIALAERQSAKLFQLRASTSLARLWCDQGKQAEARDLLGPIYNWFIEGFDART